MITKVLLQTQNSIWAFRLPVGSLAHWTTKSLLPAQIESRDTKRERENTVEFKCLQRKIFSTPCISIIYICPLLPAHIYFKKGLQIGKA
jgi:hypothetical protein